MIGEGPYSGHSQDRTLQCIHPFINFCIGDRISRLLCNYTTSNFKLYSRWCITVPPVFERHVEVLPEVEDVEGQPADDEEGEGGEQHHAAPDVPPLLLDLPAALSSDDGAVPINASL